MSEGDRAIERISNGARIIAREINPDILNPLFAEFIIEAIHVRRLTALSLQEYQANNIYLLAAT